MIHPLSLDNINRKAPYKVELDEMTGSYDFVTHCGVQISTPLKMISLYKQMYPISLL